MQNYCSSIMNHQHYYSSRENCLLLIQLITIAQLSIQRSIHSFQVQYLFSFMDTSTLSFFQLIFYQFSSVDFLNHTTVCFMNEYNTVQCKHCILMVKVKGHGLDLEVKVITVHSSVLSMVSRVNPSSLFTPYYYYMFLNASIACQNYFRPLVQCDLIKMTIIESPQPSHRHES